METAREIFKNFLRTGKHRITPERFEVMDFAVGFKGHFGTDELYITMKNKRSNISRATVYNTLELLEKCGLLAKRNFGDNTKRYESNFKRKNHDHLICINCGAIQEFSNQDVQKIVKKICQEMGFESAGYSFNIFGKCLNSQKCKKISNG